MDADLADRFEPTDDVGDEGFALANLRPADTGLPMTIWVSEGEGVRHDVRVKVSLSHGHRYSRTNAAVVAVRPEPRLLHGQLDRSDFEAVANWIRLNEHLIVAYWTGEVGTRELLDRLQRI